MNLTGLIKRFDVSRVLVEAAEALRLTGTKSTSVTTVEAARSEMTRAGRSFILGNNAAITGVAITSPTNGFAAALTTQAQWIIWNNDLSQSLVFEELGMYLTVGTPSIGGLFMCALFSTITTPITGVNTAGAVVTNAALGKRQSQAIVQSSAGNVITTPAAPNWYPLATNTSSQTATVFPSDGGFFEHRNVQGSLIVPPQQGLALGIIGPAGAGTQRYAPFGRWYEIDLDLE